MGGRTLCRASGLKDLNAKPCHARLPKATAAKSRVRASYHSQYDNRPATYKEHICIISEKLQVSDQFHDVLKRLQRAQLVPDPPLLEALHHEWEAGLVIIRFTSLAPQRLPQLSEPQTAALKHIYIYVYIYIYLHICHCACYTHNMRRLLAQEHT